MREESISKENQALIEKYSQLKHSLYSKLGRISLYRSSAEDQSRKVKVRRALDNSEEIVINLLLLLRKVQDRARDRKLLNFIILIKRTLEELTVAVNLLLCHKPSPVLEKIDALIINLENANELLEQILEVKPKKDYKTVKMMAAVGR
ncbi:hypothetical protein J4210_03025 [Candidatus Woesearchaeota archaeon]|nr:hypothetical protein [Candidatus Woesearchaeota archaeon]